jgi:hypothetical protein
MKTGFIQALRMVESSNDLENAVCLTQLEVT